MNQINESNIQAFKSKQFQEINGNNFNIYTPQSLQNMMDPSYIPKHVTRGGRRTGLHALFQKSEKGALIWEKNALIAVICGLNFSMKLHFLRFYGSKNRIFFPAGPFFFIL